MLRHRSDLVFPLALALVVTACTTTQSGSTASSSASSSLSTNGGAQSAGLPADAAGATARLNSSPRHGEWAMIKVGATDSLRLWVVYPERKTKAPVIVVVHEIFGLSDWIRGVADQFAADGFVAVAPDFLTMKNLPQTNDSAATAAAVAAIRTLDLAQVQLMIDAAAQYGMALPAAQKRYGVVGFCWGGGVSFTHATHSPTLGASVVYYGTSPKTELLSAVRAPVLGLYGANDARVNATIPPADSAMKAMKKTYEPKIFEGAGHGFLRQQTGANGANMTATQQAWPATIAWFKKYLDS